MPQIQSHHQILIVGGGMGGLRAAVEASQTCNLALISKVHPLRSHPAIAQGGINAALGHHPEGKDDSWEKHALDTIKRSDYLADQDAVEIMCREAIEQVHEMERWGMPFSRFEDGRLAQRACDGTGFPRACYAADRTAHHLLHTLWEQVARRDIIVYEGWLVTSLIVSNGVCLGVVALDVESGKLRAFASSAVIMATGGFGRLYDKSSEALFSTGRGAAVAYRAGAPIEDMEFVQFHPTAAAPIEEEPVPLQPGQRYSMGGIAIDVDGQTSVPGLYAVGECSCLSVHGAKRLGGNSLLESVVFGKRVGEAAAQYVSSCVRPSRAETPRREALLGDQEKVEALMKRDKGESSHVLRERMQTTMMEKVGILRQEGSLKEALEEIEELKERFQQVALDKDDNQDLVEVLELEGMLDLAETVTAGALARQESRGSHRRLDYPNRDDENWLKHSMFHYTEISPRQTYKRATITRYQPE